MEVYLEAKNKFCLKILYFYSFFNFEQMSVVLTCIFAVRYTVS